MKKSFMILIVVMLWIPMAAATLDAQSLVYSISVRHSVDKKSGVTVKISLRNVSDEPVVIEKRSLNYSIVFIKCSAVSFNKDAVYMTGDEAYRITGDPAEGSEGELVLLQPNGILTAQRALNLNDKFFERKRDYTVRLTYGQFRYFALNNIKAWIGTIESNEAKFKIR